MAVIGFAGRRACKPPTVIPFRGGGDIVLNLVGGNLEASLVNYAEANRR